MERQTYQRSLILETLGELHHASQKALFEALRQKAPRVAMTTLYRNLFVMANEGLIRAIPIRGVGWLYEDILMAPHPHFYCTSCHRLFDLPALSETAPLDGGFQVEGECRVLYGLCPACRQVH